MRVIAGFGCNLKDGCASREMVCAPSARIV